MFKKGQILRNRVTGCAVLVLEWPEVKRLSAPRIGRAPIGRVYPVAKGCDHLFALIGNNYQERPTTKTEKPAVDKETHNLITKLRASNHRLRQMNSDLRDDIGDMASKLHLAYRDRFPGIAALWPTPEALPEQRGCRKEDC